jgi:hypothetical protein
MLCASIYYIYISEAADDGVINLAICYSWHDYLENT